MKVDILIAHPGKHHVYHLIAGCIKAGASVSFITPLYRCGLGRLISAIPGKIGNKARGYFNSDIPLESVTSPLRWQVKKLISLFNNNRSFEHEFDEFVASQIKSGKYQARVFVTLQDYMPKSVILAKQRGMLILSDQISNQSQEATDRISYHQQSIGLDGLWQHSEDENNRIIAISDFITVPSKYCLDGIQQRLSSDTRVFTIPYGANTKQFSGIRVVDEQQITILARANSVRKGGHLLLRSLSECSSLLLSAAPGKKIKVVILGKLEPELDSILKNLDFPAEVSILHGNVPFSQVAKLYEQAQIFIMPSLSESMSLACIEALHAGLPLIITEYCGIDGFVSGEMGYLVEDSIESLKEALIDAFNNQDHWQEWGANSRALARGLTWEAYEKTISKMTKKVLL